MSDPTTPSLSDVELRFPNSGEEPKRADDSKRAAVAASLDKAALKVQAGGEKVGNAALGAGEKVGHLAQSAAEKLEATAQYVRDHDRKDMMSDVEAFAKKHPGKSLLAVALVGFLAGRAFRD